MRDSNNQFSGYGNANTAADRPSAITAGEAAASDGDSACPAVPASPLDVLSQVREACRRGIEQEGGVACGIDFHDLMISVDGAIADIVLATSAVPSTEAATDSALKAAGVTVSWSLDSCLARVAAVKERDLRKLLRAAQPRSDWAPIETAPKDGTSFVAWLVQSIAGSRDRRAIPIVARWKAPDGWVWCGPRGTLTAWTPKPHTSFSCLHESDYLDHGLQAIVCDDCGAGLEDLS